MFGWIKKKEKGSQPEEDKSGMNGKADDDTKTVDPKAETRVLRRASAEPPDEDTKVIEITHTQSMAESEELKSSVAKRHENIQRLAETVKHHIETKKIKRAESKSREE